MTLTEDQASSKYFMIRLDREVVERLQTTIEKHPLRPTLRATIERAIVLMIEDLHEEIRRAQ
jgi:hypothetical protein